jgi:hypothetical protein
MRSWIVHKVTALLGRQLEWLLEEANPSVCYFTLRDILGKGEGDPQVVAARRAIPESPVVKKIMERQKPEGYWESPGSPYLPKYKSSYWQIMVLGRLGMDRTNERVKKACEHILRFQHEEGGFVSQTRITASKEYKWLLQKGRRLLPFEEWASSLIFEQQISCLTGNIVAALLRLGYEGDPRLNRALDWLIRIQHPDGGWQCPYWRAHIKDRHSCFHGTICALEGLSELREERLTREMRDTIERAAEFLLMHRLYKADHHGYVVINQSWLKLDFPWFWGYNVLRGLDVLTKLGYVKDERMENAVEFLLQKRQEDGTWILENSPVGRMQANIERKGEPSKWITLIAMRIMKRLNLGRL